MWLLRARRYNLSRFPRAVAHMSLALCILGPSSSLGAGKLRTFYGVEMGYGTFRFAQKLDQRVVFPIGSFTAGLAYQRFNVLLSLSQSLDDADVSEEEFTGTVNRRDIDLALVYQINKSISLFTGYKQGRSELDSLTRPKDDDNPNAAPAEMRGEHFDQDGYFFGASYNWKIAESGRLSVSLAYADLDASNKFVGDGGEDGKVELDNETGESSGESTGLSYGLTWTVPVAGNWLYRARLRINRYEQTVKINGRTYPDVEESSASLLMGIVYVY